MGIMDRLRPKWDNSNYDVRINEIEKLNDLATLKKIVVSGRHTDARKAALSKIEDESVLAELAEAPINLELILEAIKRIKDTSLLAMIVASSDNESICKEAMNPILEQDFFSLIVQKHPLHNVRREAVKYILDLDLLARIAASNDQCDFTKWKAIDYITDNDILRDLYFSEKEDTTRIGIVGNISDLQLLTLIVREDKSESVRSIALKLINDQAIIMETAKNDSSQMVRREAISRVVDKDFLKGIAESDVNEEIRDFTKKCFEILEIDNTEKILEIIDDEKNHYIRAMAVSQISDADVLFDLAMNHLDSDLCNTAAANPNLKDEVKLLEIVNHVEDPVDSNWMALERISNPSYLAEIAANNVNAYVRIVAAQKIQDKKILLDIASRNNDKEVRFDALRILKKLQPEERDLAAICSGCARKLSDDADGKDMIAVLLGQKSDELATVFSYACKSCNALFCLDCMAEYRNQKENCPVCKQALG